MFGNYIPSIGICICGWEHRIGCFVEKQSVIFSTGLMLFHSRIIYKNQVSIATKTINANKRIKEEIFVVARKCYGKGCIVNPDAS